MPSDRFSSARLLRSVAVVIALASSALLSGGVAGADELAGTTVVGELVQVWAEDELEGAGAAAHAAEGPLSFVETAAGDAVRVRTEDVADLPAGATVSVTVGAQVDDEAVGEHGVDPARTVLAGDVLSAPTTPAPTVIPRSGLTNEVTVVLVAPAGSANDGTRLPDVVAPVDGAVAEFWAEQSNGAIRVGVTAAHDWTSTTVGCADPAALWNETAAAVGFVPGPGRHLLLYVSTAAPDCAYALAQVGAAPASGGRLYVRNTAISLIAHELGHNFGLGHSSGRQCDASVETGTCRTAAYRDLYDVMGVSWAQLGSLNAPQAARLGVLPGADVQAMTVQSAGATVTLAPLAGRTGVRALRLTDADGVDYWLEYRTPIARDAWLETGNAFRLDAGVLLRQAGRNLPDTSLLLDGTPSAAAGWDADLKTALPVGAAVPVSGGDFTVTVRSVSATGAVVDVVPTPTAATGVPAPAAAPPAAGTVMSGTVVSGTPVTPVAEVAAPAAPVLTFPAVHRTTPLLEPAAETAGNRFVVLLAGAVLAGVLLLAAHGMRRRVLRRR